MQHGCTAPRTVHQPGINVSYSLGSEFIIQAIGMWIRTMHVAFPAQVSAMAFAGLECDASEPLVVVTVDLGWLLAAETAELLAAVAAGCGPPVESGRLLVQMVHTHAGPSLTRPFVDGQDCPGGSIALQWWAEMKVAAAEAAAEAVGGLEQCWLTSAVGRCDLAQQQVRTRTLHPSSTVTFLSLNC